MTTQTVLPVIEVEIKADGSLDYPDEFLATLDLVVNTTPPDFSGDYSVVIFPFVKISKKSPDATAAEIGGFFEIAVCENNGGIFSPHLKS